MPKEIKIYSKSQQIEKSSTHEVITVWSTIVFKLSLLVGAFISWAFFSFFVQALPSLGNLGDVTIYLISISAWSFLIAFILVALTFGSSFLIRYSLYFKDYPQKIIAYYYVLFPIFATTILFMLNFFNISDITAAAFLFFIIIPISFSLFLTVKINRTWMDGLSDIGFPLILFSFIVLVIDYAIKVVITDGFLAAFFIILSIAFFSIWNYLIIIEKKLNWKIGFFIIGTTLIIQGIAFTSAKISNPFIVSPFKLLQLGYYNAELHFKDDFINKANPFALNETNRTSNTFFILSSIGDEYILRETRKAMEYNASQNNHHNGLFPFDYNGTRYFCEDDNKSLIWRISDTNKMYIQKVKNRTHDFNETVQKQLEYWKTIDKKIYRIKKENVEFEVVGKEIDAQSTIWEQNAKK